jgi:hypothetical protein
MKLTKQNKKEEKGRGENTLKRHKETQRQCKEK